MVEGDVQGSQPRRGENSLPQIEFNEISQLTSRATLPNLRLFLGHRDALDTVLDGHPPLAHGQVIEPNTDIGFGTHDVGLGHCHTGGGASTRESPPAGSEFTWVRREHVRFQQSTLSSFSESVLIRWCDPPSSSFWPNKLGRRSARDRM